MVDEGAMTVVYGRTIMASFVCSMISSTLCNVLFCDDAFNNMICVLIIECCVSVNIEGKGICGVQVPRMFQFSGS